MPVQNNIHKIFARPDLATLFLQILMPTTFSSVLCQKGLFALQPCLRWFVRKIYGYAGPNKQKMKILQGIYCLPKKQFFRKLPVQKIAWTDPG